MIRRVYLLLILLLCATAPAFATVVVSSPLNASTVSTSATYQATAASTCRFGVATMGIYVDNKLQYVGLGASLNTTITLSAGSHTTYVEEWDYCGGASGTTVTVTAANQAGVYVTSPANNSTVSSSVAFSATATSNCSLGVASMGVYVNDQLEAVQLGSSLNQQLTLPSGTQQATVQSWDYCGGSANQPLTLKVGSTSNATTLSAIQADPSWNQWGELPPNYDICSPCNGVNWSMTQNVSSPSESGNATAFKIGGTVPYSDVLWSNKLLGQDSTLGIYDTDHKIIPNIYNMTLSGDVYITNYSVTQDIELDVNIYLNGAGMEWGTECNHLADGDWDIWDNVNAKWIATGAPCSLNNNAWNHISIQVQRESNNDLLYQSITVNGTTYTINQTYAPFSVPSGWYGLTVNYQMDGNYNMSTNTTYVDNLQLQYW